MSKYVIDAYAWIEYLDRSEAGGKVKALLEENDETYTCALTIAEVVSKIARKGKNVKIAYDVLLSNSHIINIDEELSWQAGLLYFEMRKTLKDFGLAAAYALAMARRLKAKVLTGNPHFKSVREAVLIT
jgi:PIN domain nuclease of toxin-antitoxin system